MRYWILAFLLMIGSLPVAAYDGQAAAKPAYEPLQIVSLSGKTHAIQVRFAVTQEQQRRGLMWVTDLPQGTGMIFPISPPRIARFWMRNTLIPLDMLFIAPGGMIIKIVTRRDTNSEATTSSDVPVSAVLELPAGEAARLKIGVGDVVRHKRFTF